MALTPLRGSGDPFFIDPHYFDEQVAKRVSAVANTRVDWLETADAHVFKADLPGLSKEEIKIKVDGDRTLQISGDHKKETVEHNDKYHCMERARVSFLRRFRLPEDANIDAIKAEVNNGLLTVTVPKAQPPSSELDDPL